MSRRRNGAQVQIDQGDPQVTYEAEEPVVRIERDGDEQTAEDDAAQDQAAQDQATQDQVAQDQSTQDRQAADGPAAAEQDEQARVAEDDQQQWRGDRQAMAQPQVERDGYQEAEVSEPSVDNLPDADVYDANDENVGSFDDVVMGPGRRDGVCRGKCRRFPGLGAHQVALGFDELSLLRADDGADQRVYVEAIEEQLQDAPEYQARDREREVRQNRERLPALLVRELPRREENCIRRYTLCPIALASRNRMRHTRLGSRLSQAARGSPHDAYSGRN